MRILPSSGEGRLREIKRGLVLKLYLREGTFWAEIQVARECWGVKPETCLPPAHLQVPYPQGDSEKAQEWANEMHSFLEAFVADSWRYQRATDWESFFGACVLYDPPELELARFADYGGTKPEGGDRPGMARGEDAEGPGMVAPPIHWLPTLSQFSDRLGEFYDALIKELGRRYVEPTGKGTNEVIIEIKGLARLALADPEVRLARSSEPRRRDAGFHDQLVAQRGEGFLVEALAPLEIRYGNAYVIQHYSHLPRPQDRTDIRQSEYPRNALLPNDELPRKPHF